MHGITGRLVGRRDDYRSLESYQSAALNEAISDFFGCTLSNTTTIAKWLTDDQNGIRGRPYTKEYPDKYEHLGTEKSNIKEGRYKITLQENGAYFIPIHACGEILAAALLEMHRNLNNPLLSKQLVLDALRKSPDNPDFISFRDSIVFALGDMYEADKIKDEEIKRYWESIWLAFAHFGMGPAAISFWGAPIADYKIPSLTHKPDYYPFTS
jgi:hypothetical protein